MTQLRKCCTKLFIVIIGSKREILIPIDNQGARDFAKFDRNRNNSYTWNPSPGYGQVSREIKASISFLFRWSLDRAAASLVTLAPRFVAHYFDQPRVSPPILRRFEESGRTRPYIRRLFFLFFFFQPDARPSSGYTLRPEDPTLPRYTKIGDAIDELAIRTWSSCALERVATALCKSTTTRTTWGSDWWERYDGTGAARNFLDNIGRSGRATGANADAYVSGGATRIHAIGACPSRTSPLPPARVVHPRHFPLLSLSPSHPASSIISLCHNAYECLPG